MHPFLLADLKSLEYIQNKIHMFQLIAIAFKFFLCKHNNLINLDASYYISINVLKKTLCFISLHDNS